MVVRLVREEDPQAVAPATAVEEVSPILRFPPEKPVWVEPPAPQSPPPEPKPDLRQAVTIQALGVMVALAQIISIRASLILTILASAGLTLFAEAQHEHQLLAIVGAGLFTVFALIPIVALALRKG